jgi:hypothetical protein
MALAQTWNVSVYDGRTAFEPALLTSPSIRNADTSNWAYKHQTDAQVASVVFGLVNEGFNTFRFMTRVGDGISVGQARFLRDKEFVSLQPPRFVSFGKSIEV